MISARIAVEEAAPPVSVATWLPKKYLSSKMPRGLARYFWVVTREIVDSWSCLLYTSDAADERSSVDLGGRRIIKKKNQEKKNTNKIITIYEQARHDQYVYAQ